MAKRPASPLEECVPKRMIPPDDPGRVTVTSLAQAGRETFADKLQFDVVSTDKQARLLVVGCKTFHWNPPAGFLSRTRVLVHEDRSYFFQVLLKSKQVGEIETEKQFLSLCEMMANEKGEYKFCPGIEPAEDQTKYFDQIRYDIKNVRRSDHPFKRIDSINCQLYFKISKNASIIEKGLECVPCSACKRLIKDLNQRLVLAVTSPERIKRQQSSSHCPMKYMSPTSQKKRKQNTQQERAKHLIQLQKYSHTELTLDDDQHDELCKLMATIEERGTEEIEEILKEADNNGAGDAVREIWQMDKMRMKKEFDDDQGKNCTGKRSNCWSAVTIRLALAVYCRSPAAYDALKSFELLQLPSRSTLQAYTGAFLEDCGSTHERMARETERFASFKQQCLLEKKKEPKADGVLIFDEVKVISRLMWNSRSQKIIGLAMNVDDMSALHDAYQLVNEESAREHTSYILQFLWRDLTSSFDVVGPYYTSSGPLESKFIVSCVFQSLRLFYLYHFNTCALVCDGASSNVSALKLTCGTSGAYGVSTSTESDGDKHKVEPYFCHPFQPEKKIFWVICPSHQLKNMINALHSSRDSGKKAFQHNGTTFGWKYVYKMWTRECTRREKGLARMVPKLREIHIIRDAWTKLNVAPAKIMQQQEVLSEMYKYVHEIPVPEDHASAKLTLEFLEACNKIFEQGLLSHDKVDNIDCRVLRNIQKGYEFFTKWLNNIYEQDPSYSATDSGQKKFLSWQTWDNLRIDVYGFTALTKNFLENHPGYFLSPLRISGSAVETLFGQYKYMSGSKLDAANYPTCRSKYLANQAVHHSGQFYRDQDLTIPVAPLEKKKYKRSTKSGGSGGSSSSKCN